MNLITESDRPADTLSAAARRRFLSSEGNPILVADWERAVFMHFGLDADVLQEQIPYELDRFDGRGYVSLVAFTMRRLRLRFGGRWLALMMAPVASHELLNLRTYVRHGEERGIYFITEWVPRLLSRLLGPMLYGLPYRLGRLAYEHEESGSSARGRVTASPDLGKFVYRGERRPAAELTRCRPGSLDEFLLERYIAFTVCASKRRLFRVWHEPWLYVPFDVAIEDQSLIVRTQCWFQEAACVGAHFAPGVPQVWMGRPRRIKPTAAGDQGQTSRRYL